MQVVLRAAAMVAATTAMVAAGTAASTTATAAPTSYSFLDSNPPPARWDPCRPIDWQVNLAQAPAGALSDLQEAIRRASAATGLTFVYGGTTTITPASGTANPAGVEAVVSWSKPGQSNYLALGNGAAGVGGGRWGIQNAYRTDGTLADRFVSGYVVMNADLNGRLRPGFDTSGSSQGSILLHEVSHMIGMGHTSGGGQIMNTPTFSASYGDGDLAGLDLLGRSQGCLTDSKPTGAAPAPAPSPSPTVAPPTCTTLKQGPWHRTRKC